MTDTDWKATLKAAQDKIEQENAAELERLRKEGEAENAKRSAIIADWLVQWGLPRGEPLHGHVRIDDYVFKMYGTFTKEVAPRCGTIFVEPLYTGEEWEFLIDYDFYPGDVQATCERDMTDDQFKALLWSALERADRDASAARTFIETQQAAAVAKRNAESLDVGAPTSLEEALRLRWWSLLKDTVQYFIRDYNEIPF